MSDDEEEDEDEGDEEAQKEFRGFIAEPEVRLFERFVANRRRNWMNSLQEEELDGANDQSSG